MCCENYSLMYYDLMTLWFWRHNLIVCWRECKERLVGGWWWIYGQGVTSLQITVHKFMLQMLHFYIFPQFEIWMSFMFLTKPISNSTKKKKNNFLEVIVQLVIYVLICWFKKSSKLTKGLKIAIQLKIDHYRLDVNLFCSQTNSFFFL